MDRNDEGSSRQCFEVADRTDEVSNPTTVKAKLTWFEEIFESITRILSTSNQFAHKKKA
ncbi:hypothetical protein [Streptococcus pneumoniae]|uniref:hypothetical protein n=1 Tax=Streptococcus pneumoniae TaxID=1313 RepID=UPI001877A883|nr:hypothetical protein [Streptococcus pneumoniae]